MAKGKNETTDLKKMEASFNLIGKIKKLGDFTFKMEETTNSSDWVWNSMNICVDCGKDGEIYSEMMGGYGSKRDNVVYVHGKKENENKKMIDDFSNRWTIDWEDRLDESLFDDIGEMQFLTVGIEKDIKGKTLYKKFLSEYDAIAYVKEHLEEDMIVNVKGNIEYSVYNEYTQKKKKIQSIVLSKIENEEDFRATFSQTVLLTKDSVQPKDKEKNVVPIESYVVEYLGKPKIDGKKVEIKKNCVYSLDLELPINEDESKTLKLIKKLFKPAKANQVFEVTLEGHITKGGVSTVDSSLEDLPEDILYLVECGVYTEEEALEKVVGNNKGIETFVISKPKIKVRVVDGKKMAELMFDSDKYNYDDLVTYAELINEFTDDDNDDDDDNVDEGKDIDLGLDDDEEMDLDSLLDGIE